MSVGLYHDDFARAFSKLLDGTGVTCYQVNQFTGLNQAYLSRLKNGEKHNPSPETIMKISLAIVYSSRNVSLYDIEALFNAAGRSLRIKY